VKISRLKNKRQSGAAIAEFGPTLIIFFLLIFIPFLDLISFIWGVATIAMAANVAARNAGSASTYTQAKTNVTNTGTQIVGGPFGKFANLTPQDGTGLTLKALQVPINGGAASTYVAGSTPDTTNNFYEYQVTAKYGVMPLFNFSKSGFFQSVPGLGKAADVSFTSASHCEHPDGLPN
jgi:hypothetical protein